jgi:hypothetical protein
MKKHIIRFTIIFFIVIALLTYFSKTIDSFLLPQVKVTDLETGTIKEQSASNDMKTHYLIPLSSVTSFGDDGTVFVLQTEESDTVTEVSVTIHDSDDYYYEVTSDNLYSEMRVVYSVSKPITNDDRVYVEEE